MFAIIGWIIWYLICLGVFKFAICEFFDFLARLLNLPKSDI